MVSKLQPHRKRKGERPDVSKGAGTQVRQPGGEWKSTEKPREEGIIKPLGKEIEKPQEPTPISKGLGAKEVLFGKPKIKGKEVQLGYAPALGGFPTDFATGFTTAAGGKLLGKGIEVTGTYGKDVGQASRIIIDVIKSYPRTSAGVVIGSAFLAKSIAEKNDLAVWAAVDNVGQKASFAASESFRMYQRGEIDQAQAITILSDLQETNNYAEGFVKSSVAINPSNWFGLGEPFLVASRKNQESIEFYLDLVKGGG